MKKGKKVMVVEDDADIQNVISELLISEGYTVVRGSSVTDLFEIEKDPPALVLLDNWLDGKTGHDICYSLKSTSKTSSIKVVLVSATPNLEQTAQSCMADGFITKPFDNNNLLAVVKKMVGK